MQDRFMRSITYARLSLTGACNLHCCYCRPTQSFQSVQALSDRQVVTLVQALHRCGIRKIRFTGGEPLLRPGVRDLLTEICRIPGIEWAITTNGLTLAQDAAWLHQIGIQRMNISLDTTNAVQYHALSGGDVRAVLDGLHASQQAGFAQIKLNTVLIRGVTESQFSALAGWTQTQPLDVRFIELMPIGACRAWAQAHFLPAQTVLDALPDLQPEPSDDRHAPARYFRLPDARGRIGLITPMSCDFCAACNRIRITCDGKLKPCLHADTEIDLAPVLDDPDALAARIRDGILHKPARHHLQEQRFIARCMTSIGG